jgi:hypothetical protein
MRAYSGVAFLWMCLAVLPCRADIDDLSEGVFIAHHVQEISFTSDPPAEGWCDAYSAHAIGAAEEQVNSVTGPRDNVMWVVLSAWQEEKQWSGAQFGFLGFDPDLFVFYDYGPCYPAADGLEISSLNWPAPNTGTAMVIAGGSPWSGNYVPVYWFAGYAYGPPSGQTVIPLGPDPMRGFCGWTAVSPPYLEYEAICLGGMGINAVGEACWPAVVQPDRFACCLPSGSCVILTESACLAGGGEWLAGTPSCDPNPCTPLPAERACCFEGLVCGVLEEQGCLASGGRWLPDALSCDPNPCPSVYVLRPDGTGDFPTLQAAIDVAPNGTIIELTYGTFTGPGNRNVDFQGKSVRVRSQNGVPELCVIDCQNMGRAFVFNSGEGPTTEVQGISVVHGNVNYGGAIMIEGASPTISNCVFDNNEASIQGGAIICRTSQALIRNCAFGSNHARVSGGAVFLDQSDVHLEDCVFVGNTAGTGGAVSVLACQVPIFARCTFQGNSVIEYGGAVLLTLSNAPQVLNCTISDNAGAWGAGGIRCDYASPHLRNTFIGYSTRGEALSVNDPGQCYPTLECCDLFGNAWGDWVGSIAQQYGQSGNISLDPLFLSRSTGDFRLLPDSPCAPFSPPNTGCDLIGAWPVVDPQHAPLEPKPTPTIRILDCTPNPVTDAASIAYELAGAGADPRVRLVILDPEGRFVRLITDEIARPGVHTVQWDGRDQQGRPVAGGSYYLRLQAGAQNLIRPLVVLR